MSKIETGSYHSRRIRRPKWRKLFYLCFMSDCRKSTRRRFVKSLFDLFYFRAVARTHTIHAAKSIFQLLGIGVFAE